MALVEQLSLDPLDAGFASAVSVRHDLVPGVELHPAVARWFEHRFPAGATPPQVEGWPHIAAGANTLIAAPTGSGKTLAGFLMAINRFYLDHAAGRAVDGTRVVYVSPLKALAVDIAENLERPLAEIAETARAMGLTAPELTIAVRTGDTPSGERQSMVRRPRSFVVTTPESLYLLVTAARSREMLRTVETVIVDEIHAMARDKRGSHLSLTLERLDHVCRSVPGEAGGGRSPVRIGLSATQRPIETVARLLVGVDRSCRVVDTGHQRALDLAIELPDAELEAVASHAQMGQVLDHIAELVAQHRTTLVFVNTRSLAERLAHELGERLAEAHHRGGCPDEDCDGEACPHAEHGRDLVAAHHGSLSKDRRHRVERRLRAGELKALVATASLELGIDVGPVELVCQLGSPRSIATFLQRVGRSNHTRHGTPRGRLYPLTRDELIECTALLTAVRAGRLDVLQPPAAPLDILAQQIVAETGAEEWATEGLYRLVTRAAPYADLDRAEFDRIVELVSEGIMTGRGRRAAWVHHDGVNGELRGRRGARFVALTSGGAIPEIYDMRVVAEPDETFIGTVTEDWAIESAAGDIFLLGTHSWKIRQVAGGVVRVLDAGDAPPTVPFWTGEAPARTAELSDEVSRLRGEVDRFVATGDHAGAVRWLVEVSGVPDDAAGLIVTYLATARTTLGVIPTGRCLVMERFFDDADGMQLVIHSPLGGRINRAMGYALRKKFCVGFNFELQAAASDDAVVISLGPHHSFPLTDVRHFLRPDNIRETLTQAVLDQPAFQSRWRWNLNRALIVLRMRNGKRNPPPIQRMESDDLLAALFPDAAACQENVTGPAAIPDHPLVAQTIHDTLTEGMDVDGLIELWRALGEGRVEMRCVDSAEPSVLSHEILTARPYAFLDDGEAGERRTRAAPIRRGLPVDPDDMAALNPDAVAEVRAELAPDPRTADDLHDLLRDVVLLAARPEWQPLMDELVARGRAEASADGGGRWFAAESSPRVEALLGGRPVGEVTPELAAADLIRGHLELHSPTTADQLVAVTGVSSTLVQVGLATLENEGSAIQGRFTEAARRKGDGSAAQWCSRRLLARMHRRSRASRRRAIDAITPEQFVRFLTRWQHVAPGSQAMGPAGLQQVIEQLQGWEAAAAAWEPYILAARIRNYQLPWMDRLCHDGEIQWLRLRPRLSAVDSGDAPEPSNPRGAGMSKATPVSVVCRPDLPWLLAATRGDGVAAVPDVGAVAEIAAVLTEHGPRFLTELAADTGRLLTDVEKALWDGVGRGLFTADGFDAVRNLTAGAAAQRQAARRMRAVSKLRRSGVRAAHAAGRWSQVPEVSPVEDRDELAEAVVDQLLQRWGVIFYDLAAHENLALPWRELQWALRRLEDRGLVLGGRFVNGFSGEQFALPEAVEAIKLTVRASPSSASGGGPGTTGPGTVTVCGSDPLNLTGVILPGPRIPARRTERVTVPC